METPVEEYPDGSAAALYESHTTDRQPYLDRGYDASELTLPSVLPRNGHTATSKFYSPYQSVGARGSKNLAAKLLLAILPPSAPFFRLKMSEDVEDSITKGDEKLKATIEDALSKQERSIQTAIEQTSTRVTLAEGLLHFVITGNGLFFVPEDGNTRFYPLSQYVILRDPSGTVLKIVTKEMVSRSVLSPAQLALIDKQIPVGGDDNAAPKKPEGKEKSVSIYTSICREATQWTVHQELNGVLDPDPAAVSTYPLDACAYIPVRFRKIDGEAYGRGYVEENIGDLRSLEGLTASVVEAAAGLSKMLILVNPNGVTSKKTISNSPNLAVRDGKAEDVTFLRSDKTPDLNWVNAQIERLSKSLEQAFMLGSAVSRDAERVTAEEIRVLAQELEDGFGAVYSILTQELQLPLAKRFIATEQKKGNIKALPKGAVMPQIITGLEALGRGHDLTRLQTFVQFVMQLVPNELSTYLDIQGILTQAATAIGVDSSNVNTADQISQTQQAAQQSALAQKGVGPLINKVGDAYNQGAAAVGGPAGAAAQGTPSVSAPAHK